MDETTIIRTPYEEMHQGFVLRLLMLKDDRGNLSELRDFLQCFAGIRSTIESVELLEAPFENVMRILIKQKPITILDEEEHAQQPLPDWIVDFLFSDSIVRVGYTINHLVWREENLVDAKRALIHFGCSPDSLSVLDAKDAFVTEISQYDSYRSIDVFEMAQFLESFKDVDERYFEVYAEIINAYAKKKAIDTWKKDPKAFSFLCKYVIAEGIEKQIGTRLLVSVKMQNGYKAEVCFSLPEEEWVPLKEDEQDAFIHGLTLHVHYVSGNPLAHLGISHRGTMRSSIIGEEPISTEMYKQAFFKKFDMTEIQYNWAKDIEYPLDDEFAYSFRALQLHHPCDEFWDPRLYQDTLSGCKRVADGIAEEILKIKKHLKQSTSWR